MSNVIKLRKGLDIHLQGAPKAEVRTVESATRFSISPDDFNGITPKVVVKDGEAVKAGQPLFVDKNNPQLCVVAPASGKITAVVRGERRKILHIDIEADAVQTYQEFETVDVANLTAESAKTLLLQSGLFAFLRQRPYDVVANPNVTPRAIFVTAFDSAPLAPAFELALKGEAMKQLQLGINVLAKIAPVSLGINPAQAATALAQVQNAQVNVFEGAHPAGNVGVQIANVAPVNKGETVWTLDAETLLFIGRLVTTGKVDLTRLVAVTGSEVTAPAYCHMKVGEQVVNALKGQVKTGNGNLRYISGNVLTGTQIPADGYLGAFHHQITVIPEGDDVHEMFGWIMPRTSDFSTSRSYLSWLCGKKEYRLDARIKGGERHMIMSSEYDKVLPMDIFPEYLIKAIIAGDIDRMEKLGIYEVAPEDFALCEFVCSSKMELQRIVREGLDALRKEME